jgi:hypothetical protein
MDTRTTSQQLAHIKLGTEERTVPAGPTLVSKLKQELGVDPTFVLYLVHGHERRVLGDTDTIDVKSGLHFEALPGGGVS